MGRRGRLWAACLTVTAATAGGAVAAPPSTFSWGGPPPAMPRHVGDLAPGSSQRPGLHESPTGPAAPSIVGFPALGTSPAARPVGRHGAVREYVRPSETGWVALVGEFKKPGSYEIAGSGVPFPDLLRRCDGLTERATRTLRLVRNGYPAGTISPGAEASVSLRPGDVVVAEGNGARPYGAVTFAGYERQGQPAARRSAVQLGLVGLMDRPVAVKVPGDYASVEGLLALSRQTHLTPRDVTVLVGGSRKVRGDQVVELTSGSVVVFERGDVATEEVEASGMRTQFYPAEAPPSELPQDALTQAAAQQHGPAPVLAAPAGGELVQAAEAPSSPILSAVPAPPEDRGELSSLPKVEMLAPPADEPPLGFPRTADASGAVPIGPPSVAEPHISRIPAASVYGSAEGLSSPMVAPEPPAGGSGPGDGTVAAAEGPAEEEEVSIASLAVTVAIGGALGAATFLILRRYRGRRVFGRIADRLADRVRVSDEEELADERTAVAAAPAEMLAALVADRMAFREEAIELPAAIRVYGRSSALKKRRLDPPAAAVPEPHFPIGAPAETKGRSARAESKAQFRVDPAEPIAMSAEDIPNGTPFERALAAMQRATR